MSNMPGKTEAGFNLDSPREIIEWAAGQWKDGLMMTTALGYSGMVLMSILSEVARDMPVYFINTGFHFRETIEFLGHCREKLGLNIIELKPEPSRRDFLDKHGEDIMKRAPDTCCGVNKVAPLRSLLDQGRYQAWIAALRRGQADTRKSIEIVETMDSGMIKIHPLAHWDKARVWKYISENNIPYHPLHDEGYMSIGCQPCTLKTGQGQHERDGRWAGNEKVECGLHLIGGKGEGKGDN
jgi:phosphoadenosine phosphosulfate reductase